jgi:Protein of unknown function (DUF3465)
MLRKITVLAVVLVGIFLWAQRGHAPLLPPDPQQGISQRDDGKSIVVSGVVDRILSDDREGSRHQRFILRLPSGQTLLVAHNIDLAPRLDDLSRGETLILHGQYEWNERGGVVHWTHRDPQGEHPGGYIERQGRRYE